MASKKDYLGWVQDGFSLEEVPEEERTLEVCVEALIRNIAALKYVPKKIKLAHPEICKAAVKRDGRVLEFVPDEIKIADPAICMMAVKTHGRLKHLYDPYPVEMQAWEKFKQERRRYGRLLKDIPEEIRLSHPEICLAAVRKHGWALMDVPEELCMTRPEICLEAVRNIANALQFVSEKVQAAHPEICKVALEQEQDPCIKELVREHVRIKLD